MNCTRLLLLMAVSLGAFPAGAWADPPGDGPTNHSVLLPPQPVDEDVKGPNTTREHYGEWSISAGILFVQPVFDTNPAFTVGGPNATRQVDFSHHLNVAPMVWLGYTSERGWGVRGRWWQYDNEVSESVGAAAGETIRGATPFALGQTPIAGAATATSHLFVDVGDIQGTCTWESAFWTHVVGFGVRYTHMSQDYRATLVSPATRIDLSNDHNFNGGGPTVSFESKRRLGESGFAVYGQVFGAINFGNASEGFIAVNNGVPQYFTHSWTEVLPVGELEVGAEYQRCLGKAHLFAQAGFVGQVWWNGGNASNLDGFGGVTHSNFGFLGLALRAGVRY